MLQRCPSSKPEVSNKKNQGEPLAPLFFYLNTSMDRKELQNRAGISEDFNLLPLPYPLTLDEISKELDYVKEYMESHNTIVSVTYLKRLQKALQEHSRSGYTIVNTRDA
jgi:hypothetical protein